MSNDLFLSPTFYGFTQIAKEKGWVKDKPVVKTASTELVPTENLENDLANLTSELRSRGFVRLAESMDRKYFAFKQAQLAHQNLIDAESARLLQSAHSGDAMILPGQEGWGAVHTGLSTQKKILELMPKYGSQSVRNKKMIKEVAAALGLVSLAEGEVPSGPAGSTEEHFLSPEDQKEHEETLEKLNEFREKVVSTCDQLSNVNLDSIDFWSLQFLPAATTEAATLSKIYNDLNAPINSSPEQLGEAVKKWIQDNGTALVSKINSLSSDGDQSNSPEFIALRAELAGYGAITASMGSVVNFKEYAPAAAYQKYLTLATNMVNQILPLKKVINKAQVDSIKKGLASTAQDFKELIPQGEHGTLVNALNIWNQAQRLIYDKCNRDSKWLTTNYSQVPELISGVSSSFSSIKSSITEVVAYLSNRVQELNKNALFPNQLSIISSNLHNAASNLKKYINSLPKGSKEIETLTGLRHTYDSLGEKIDSLIAGKFKNYQNVVTSETFEKVMGDTYENMSKQSGDILEQSQNYVQKSAGMVSVIKKAGPIPPLPPPGSPAGGKPAPSGGGGGQVPNTYSTKPLSPDAQSVQRMQMLLVQFGQFLNTEKEKAKTEFGEVYQPADANRIIVVGPNSTHPTDFDGTWGPNTAGAITVTNKYMAAKKLDAMTVGPHGNAKQADTNSDLLRELLSQLNIATGEAGAVKSVVLDKVSVPVNPTVDVATGDGNVPVTNRDVLSLLAFYDFCLKKGVTVTVDPKTGIPARTFWETIRWFTFRAVHQMQNGKPVGNTVSDLNNFKINSKSYVNSMKELNVQFNRWAKNNGLLGDADLDTIVVDRASLAAAGGGTGVAGMPGQAGAGKKGPGGKSNVFSFMPGQKGQGGTGGDEFLESPEGMEQEEGQAGSTDVPIKRVINLSAQAEDGVPWWNMEDTGYTGLISIGREGILRKNAIIVAQLLFPDQVFNEATSQQQWMERAGHTATRWVQDMGSFEYVDENHRKRLVIDSPEYQRSRTYSVSQSSISKYRNFLYRLSADIGKVLSDWQQKYHPKDDMAEYESNMAANWNTAIQNQLKQLQMHEQKNRQ